VKKNVNLTVCRELEKWEIWKKKRK